MSALFYFDQISLCWLWKFKKRSFEHYARRNFPDGINQGYANVLSAQACVVTLLLRQWFSTVLTVDWSWHVVLIKEGDKDFQLRDELKIKRLLLVRSWQWAIKPVPERTKRLVEYWRSQFSAEKLPSFSKLLLSYFTTNTSQTKRVSY